VGLAQFDCASGSLGTEYTTALLNGLKPYVYLSYVLDELRKMGPFPKPDDLNRLLPWSNELPEEFRTKEKK